MVHLLLWLLLLKVGVVSALQVTLDSATYVANRKWTEYVYIVDGNFISWTLGVGECKEVYIISTAPQISHALQLNQAVQISGLTFYGASAQYKVVVKGHVKTGTTSWGISLGAYRTETGVIDGPICAFHENVVCKHGGPYFGECHNHQLSVHLLGHNSLHAQAYEWNLMGSPGVLLTPNSVSSVLSLPVDLCRRDFRVRLTVTGEDYSDRKSCWAWIYVDDNESPIIENIYQRDITAEPHDIPVAMLLSATDDCDDHVLIKQTEERVENDISKCSYFLYRTWVATDVCGNAATHVQKISVLDTVAPTLVGVEHDAEYDCDKVPPPCVVESTDYNAVTVEVKEFKMEGICDCQYQVTRKWIATDCAGNVAASQQVIQVNDNVPPQIFGVPAHITVDCDSVPEAPILTATDNCCGATLTYFQNEAAGTCQYDRTIQRSWVATDSCGNSVTERQTITVKDDSPPVLTGVDDDMEVPCDEIPLPCDVEVSDNCDYNIGLTFTESTIPGTCDDEYTQVFRWDAEDVCGNTNNVSQTIQIVDNVKPKLSGLPPHSLTVDCDAVPQFTVIAKDNCDPLVEVTNLNPQTTTYLHDYTIHHSWTAQDRCGNKIEVFATLTVEDNDDPVLIGVPDHIVVNCESIPQTSVVEASDNCCDVYAITPDFNEVIIDGSCDDAFVVVRMWNVSDCSHNHKSATQTITVEDNQGPTFHGLPGYREVKCDNVPDVTDVTATDNCGQQIQPDFQEDHETGSCKTQYKILRSWSASDNCGNIASYTQTIVTYDDEAPVFENVPVDENVDCVTPVFKDPEASDNCDPYLVVKDHNVVKEGSCEYEETLYRSWVVADDCGNVATATQTIYVRDADPPYWISTPDVLIEAEYPYTGEVEHPNAEDNCEYEPTVIYEEVKIFHPAPCMKGYSLVRTWLVKDRCGNMGPLVSQKIVVTDRTPPIFTNHPVDETTECSDIPPPDIVDATDAYETVTVVFKETTNFGSCNQDYDLHRIWEATDSCGNYASTTQLVTVEDTTPPVIWGVPPDQDSECDEPPPANVSANDNCDGYLQVSLVSEHTEVGGQYTDEEPFRIVYRHWSVSDNCGNEVSADRTITVYDTKYPYFANYKGDVTVECSYGAPTVDVVIGKDDCDPFPTGYRDDTIGPGTCPQEVYNFYKWTITDHVGHKAYHYQTVTIVDRTPPVLEGYQDQIIDAECDKIPQPSDMYASDNCDDDVQVTLEKSKDVSFYGCEDSYVIYWTWTAVDACGNRATYQKTINVYDTTPPNIFCNGSICDGYEIEVECEDDFLEWGLDVTGTDNCCENVTVSQRSEIEKGTCIDAYLRIDTWTVKDSCDLYDVYVRSITVVDTTPPAWTSTPNTTRRLPYTANTECPSILDAVDKCDDDVQVVCSSSITSGICPQDYIKTCHCHAVDNCGNSIEFVQVINVYDDEAPIITYVPDVTVECLKNLQTPAPPHVNWGYGKGTVTLKNTDTLSENCTYVVVYTWLAVDDCKLHDILDQTVIVTDEDPPAIFNVPDDKTVECHPDTPVGLTGDDICDGKVIIVFDSEVINVEGTFCYTIIRTWSAVDHCGQVTVETQTIVVVDNEPPQLGYPIGHLTTDCHSLPFASESDVSVTDNCESYRNVSFTDTKDPGSCDCEWTQYRTWTACDSCGNCKIASQTVTIEDKNAPALSICPSDIQVEKDDVPYPPDVQGNDLYGAITEVNFTEVRINSTYAMGSTYLYLLVRHWITEDDCKNNEYCTQTITVVDTVPPTVPCVPKDVVLPCGPIPNIYYSSYIINHINECFGDIGDVIITLETDQTIPGSCEDEYVWIRCWKSEDHSFNTAEQCFTITVVDNEPPHFNNYPEVEFAECVPAGIISVSVTCDDNCVGVTIVTSEDDHTGGTYNGYFIRTWKCTDECGHTVVHTQTVWVADTIAPTWDHIIPDQTAECDTVPSIGDMSCTDICHNDTTVVPFKWDEIVCEGEYTKFYSWRCFDTAGNWILHEHTLFVYDTQPPTLYAGHVGLYSNTSILVSASPDHSHYTAECPWIEIYSDIYAVDNCVEYPWAVPVSSIERWGDDCKRYVVFKWTTSDECGNVAVWDQSVTIHDTKPPVLSGCINSTVYGNVHCGDPLPDPYISALDECDPFIEIKRTEKHIDGDCDHEYKIEITWSGKDRCGHEEKCSHLVEYEDREHPVLTLHGLKNLTIPCDGAYELPAVSAADDCQDYFDIDFETHQIDGTCPCEYSLYRVWHTVDKCGKDATTTQLVVVEDTEPPTLNPKPEHRVVRCLHVPPPPSLKASDNCCEVTTDYNEIRINTSCDFNYKLLRTWTAVDECGHVTEAHQTITVVDNDPPTLNLVEFVKYQLEYECHDVPGQINMTAIDECDGPVAVTPNEFTHTGSCFDAYFIYRTWHAADDCGNSVHKDQTVTVVDYTPPVMIVPPKESYECHEIPKTNNHNLFATDNCDPEPHVSFSSHILGADCSEDWGVALTWVAADRCGNEKIYTLTVDIDDTLFPVLVGVPADTTVDCYLPSVPHITVDDECNKWLVAQFNQVIIDQECPFSKTVVRRWKAVDLCDNSVEAEQTIVVQDDGPPSLDGVPDDTTIDCKDVFTRASVGFKDNECGTVSMTHVNVTTLGSCEHQIVVVYIWTAEDECGHTDTGSQTIVMHDDEHPVLDQPQGYLTAPCEDIPVPQHISASDDCSYGVAVTMQELTKDGTCDNEYILLRVWTAVDKCGNKHSVECEIAVYDEVMPTMSQLPADRTDPCYDVPIMVTPVVHDNCEGYIHRTQWEVRLDGSCPHEYKLIREYHAEDVCGNVATASYTVHVVDDEDPVLLYTPGDYSSECDSYTPEPEMTSSDNCGYEPTVEFDETSLPSSCLSQYVKFRTWGAIDECGRTDTHVQTVSYRDTTPPVIDGHEDITCEIGNIPLPWNCSWTDNCDDSEEKPYLRRKEVGTCAHQYNLVYTCTVYDCAGNVAEDTHVIHVFDFTPPVIVGLKPDTTVEYSKVPHLNHSTIGVSASDNSNGDHTVYVVGVTNKPDIIIPGYDKNDYLIIRTFVAIDTCGNTVTKHRTITVIDRTPPCFDEEPGDTTVECDAIPDPCEVFTVGEDLNVALYEGTTGNVYDGSHVIKRSWKACDHSNNCHEHTQRITVVDTTPPIFTRKPFDTTFECDCEAFPAMANLAAIDNCDDFVVVTHDEEIVGGSCPDTYELVRTWEATDHRGLKVSHTQNILIEDTTSPEFSVPSFSTTVECDELRQQPLAKIVAYDNCDDHVDVDPGVHVSFSLEECDQTITFNYSATDDCGNKNEGTFNSTITDHHDPWISGSKHCVYNRSTTDYGSNFWYKAYNFSELYSKGDGCWNDVFTTGVWFNRTTSDTYDSLSQGSGWSSVSGQNAWVDWMRTNSLNQKGLVWKNDVSTVIGTEYIFCVSARYIPKEFLENSALAKNDAGGLLVVTSLDNIQLAPSVNVVPPDVVYFSGKPQIAWKRYCIQFKATTTTTTLSLNCEVQGLLYFNIPPMRNLVHPRASIAADSLEPGPFLRTYSQEGQWIKNCGMTARLKNCGVSPFLVNGLTAPCGSVTLTSDRRPTSTYNALPSMSNDRYCYAQEGSPWRSITNIYCFQGNGDDGVYWVITDFAKNNPNGYTWMNVDGQLQIHMESNPSGTCVELFDNLVNDGVVISFWEEGSNMHSPIPETIVHGDDTWFMECPNPSITTNMQCEGACYYLGMPQAILYTDAASNGRKRGQCWCSKNCYTDMSDGQEDYCLYKWFEGFYFDSDNDLVWILAHTDDDDGININMWVEIMDFCQNRVVGKVEFWVAPSTQAAAARGRVCDQSDRDPPSYETNSDRNFTFAHSSDKLVVPKAAVEGVTFQKQCNSNTFKKYVNDISKGLTKGEDNSKQVIDDKKADIEKRWTAECKAVSVGSADTLALQKKQFDDAIFELLENAIDVSNGGSENKGSPPLISANIM